MKKKKTKKSVFLKKCKLKLGKHGSALVFVLVILAVMSVMAIGSYQSASLSRNSATFSEKSVSSFQAADSGVEFIMENINDQIEANGKNITLEEAGLCTDENPYYEDDSSLEGKEIKIEFYVNESGDPEKLVEAGDCSSYTLKDLRYVKSVGEFGGTSRAVKVNVQGSCLDIVAVQDSLPGTEAYAQSLFVGGDYAYLGTDDNSNPDVGMNIFNISDPANPQKVGFFPVQQTIAGGFCDGHITATGYKESVLGIDVVGNYAYLATFLGGLVIVDVSDKTNPTCQAELDLAGEAWSVKVVGNKAYVADYTKLLVIDVSDKNNPYIEDEFVLQEGSMTQALGPHELFVDSGANYAYVVGRDSSLDLRDGLAVVDLSDGSMSDYNLLGYNRDFYRGIDIKDGYAYIGKYNESTAVAELATYDVSDPMNIEEVDNDAVTGSGDFGSDVFVDGDKVYLSAYREVAVFDISDDPANPELVYEFDVPSYMRADQIWKHTDGKIYFAGGFNVDGKGAPIVVANDCSE